MSFEEWKDKYCNDDEGLSVLTQEDFDKLIEKDGDENSSIYVIKIDHAILEGTYDLRFAHGRCDIYISNSKLYMFDLTESLWAFSNYTFSNLTFNNCDVYCPLFVNIPYGIYNDCRIHATDSDDCSSLLTYSIARFSNCVFDPELPLFCPEEGSFIGWKVVKEVEDENKALARILKIRVPKDAKRSSALSEKCRCSKAVPLEVYDLGGNVIKPKGKLYSVYVSLFNIQATPLEYVIGKEVCSDRWDAERFNECSNGIHFFMKMEEAIQYYYYSVCR